MWFLKKRQKKDFLVIKAIEELDKLKQKEAKRESLIRLNEIIRIFLKEKYKISRGLTVEEVIKKFKNKPISEQIKLNFSSILLEIYKEEYGSSRKDPTRNQFDNYIEQTKILIKSTEEVSN